MKIIADIGGTHMRIAAVAAPDVFEEPTILDTPAEFDTAITIFADTVRKIAKGRPIVSGVVGIAGLLSTDHQTLLKAPHLRGWEGKNVVSEFGHALGVPLRFENDAALGALGEARHGAGTDASILAYVTVGTGVGGARVVDGHIDRAIFGFEIGHQRLGTNAEAPEWEELVSGSGIAQRYGKDPSEVTDPAVWEECADHFAHGLYNTILHWSPERIVLGGSLFLKQNPIPLKRVQTTLHSIASALPELPEIRLAALGNYSGLHGALILAST